MINSSGNSVIGGLHQIPWTRQGQPPGFCGIDDSVLPSNPLHISWQDGQYQTPYINASSALDYFSNAYNPFYDRTCINENLKMQGHSIEDAVKHTGIEYTVINAIEPLFVIRKQKRHSPSQVTPLADYYIIGGMVYQAPDLCSVINSRLLSSIHGVKEAFKEASSYMRYHPSKGYWWEFKGQAVTKAADAREPAEVRATAFQRTRVDALLADLSSKFPPPRDRTSDNSIPQLPQSSGPQAATIERLESISEMIAPQMKLPQLSSNSQSQAENLVNSFEKLEPAFKKLKTEPLS